jgi:hypothetical protein
MNFLKGWPFEPLDVIQGNITALGDSGGGSPG